MTDRPERPSTIVPPPDRERRTDPVLATDKAPPDDLLNLSDRLFTRLHDIEERVEGLQRFVADKLSKLDELHALLLGTPSKPGGKPRKNIVSALHDLSGNVAVAGSNAELVAEKQKTLPELVAQEVVNKVLELVQSQMSGQHERLRVLEARVDELTEPPGPNGRGHSG